MAQARVAASWNKSNKGRDWLNLSGGSIFFDFPSFLCQNDFWLRSAPVGKLADCLRLLAFWAPGQALFDHTPENALIRQSGPNVGRMIIVLERPASPLLRAAMQFLLMAEVPPPLKSRPVSKAGQE